MPEVVEALSATYCRTRLERLFMRRYAEVLRRAGRSTYHNILCANLAGGFVRGVLWRPNGVRELMLDMGCPDPLPVLHEALDDPGLPRACVYYVAKGVAELYTD